LLQAFERARLVAVDVVAELTPLTAPDEYVDLTPTTGPVPVMVPTPAPAPAPEPEPEVEHVEPVVEPVVEEVSAPEPEPVVEPEPEPEPVLEVVADVEEEPEPGPEPPSDVSALFARLRAVPPAPDPELDAELADDDADDADDDDEPTPFRARDAALTPLIVASARKLKRVLADEQNEVLAALRNGQPVQPADTFADAITVELIAAVEAGATSVGATGDVDIGPDGPLAPVRALITEDLVAPLRERVARAVDGGEDAAAKQVRAIYREWKVQRIDEHLDDVLRLAHAQGAYHALAPGAPVTWVVDPDGPPSPDCEDNALAGTVTSGDAFPSGHLTPPMHPGCRCLLVPVDG
jgi:hypothetical protein